MQLTNKTNFAANLFKTVLRDDVIISSVLVRLRHRILDSGRLELADDPPVCPDIRREQVDLGEYGILETDSPFPRQGTDVIVLGDAVVPRGQTSVATRVHLVVGEYDVAVNVFGDRVWEKQLGATTLVPSPPRRFQRMPMSLRRAFGGYATTEQGKVPNPNNPHGLGFYLTKDDAEGKPLPNLELPDQPMRAWNDQVKPIALGPYPPSGGLRVEKICEVDAEKNQIRLHPERGLFDRAHPLLGGKKLEAGMMFRLVGMTSPSPLEFQLPLCPVELVVELGGLEHVRPLALEEILVDLRPDAPPMVELAYRKLFQYRIIPFEVRKTTLRRRGD